MAAVLSAAWRGLVRPAAFFRAEAAAEKPSAAAGFLPAAVCAALVVVWGAFGPGARPLETACLAAVVLASLPLAAAALLAASRLLGSRVRCGTVLATWGMSYWATALFLASLAVSHLAVPLATGGDPASAPDGLKVLFLGLDAAAFLMKCVYLYLELDVAAGLRGARKAAAVGLLLPCAAAYALLTALAFGLKVPIL